MQTRCVSDKLLQASGKKHRRILAVGTNKNSKHGFSSLVEAMQWAYAILKEKGVDLKSENRQKLITHAYRIAYEILSPEIRIRNPHPNDFEAAMLSLSKESHKLLHKTAKKIAETENGLKQLEQAQSISDLKELIQTAACEPGESGEN